MPKPCRDFSFSISLKSLIFVWGSIRMGYRLFRSFFGTFPQVCAIVWDMLSTQRPPNSTPNHLLWGLLLLKQYNIESVNAVLVGVSEKTFRKWSLIYVRLIANLLVVNEIIF